MSNLGESLQDSDIKVTIQRMRRDTQKERLTLTVLGGGGGGGGLEKYIMRMSVTVSIWLYL